VFRPLVILLTLTVSVHAQVRLTPISEGWARNQINAVIFRRNSLTTHRNTQYASFYDAESRVVLAKRTLGSAKWELNRTELKANTADAHNSISIAVDGDGVLHVAWDHHNSPLQYRKGVAAGSLQLGPSIAMVNQHEQRVTYPEFYNLPDGDLLFLYRDGSSGNGNLIMNRYKVKLKRWIRVHDNLIDGEGQRNAYWQMAVDSKGDLHLSWVWRETPDVATNHDMCYAKSLDGGRTWRKSTGASYTLPITAATAETIWPIPQRSELINQTSMVVDAKGNPYIASYWRPEAATSPQFFVIYRNGGRWHVSQVSRRTTAFSLSGQGTRRIPISRPQIVVTRESGVHVLFRDVERGSVVSVASCNDVKLGNWKIRDLTNEPVGMWEPTLDSMMWKTKGELHLLVQNVGQGEAESLENVTPQMVSVLEWKPRRR
jgi:hypothetical protein